MQAAGSSKSIFTFVIAVSLALVLGACAQQTQTSSSTSANTASQQQLAQSASQSQPETSSQGSQDTDFQLYGNPWITSIFVGNQPADTPQAVDDLYLHVNQDFIKENAHNAPVTHIGSAGNELRDSLIAAIGDSSFTNPEFEQLRIFYNQAHDIEALDKAGADELAPYLKKVSETKTLDELERVILSDDFPFSPWIKTTISAFDMKSSMCITVLPNYMFSDPSEGSDIYQDTEDEAMRAVYDEAYEQQASLVATAAQLVSLADSYNDATDKAAKYFELEKTYAKEGDHLTKYLDAPYGAQAQAAKRYTLTELAQVCPNFPLAETLDKYGEADGAGFIVMNPAWLEQFNKVWTEDNFELLREMTEIKVLLECRDFIAPSYFEDARTALGQSELTAEEYAYAACDKSETFGQLLAKTYADRELGDSVKTQLEDLTNKLIDAYIDLVDKTSWLDAESRENVMNKIDNLALNILAPEGGYRSYSDLELLPTEKGGTLFSNYLRLKEYNEQREAELIGQPARASDIWFYLNPTTQNCFYESLSNSINIYPGFINSAVYKSDMSQEELLGSVGFVIAHEISHAFDYKGSQYSAFGEADPIYHEADAEEFKSKTAALADVYSAIEVESGWHVDGTAVSAEATADLCGLQAVLAYAASLENVDMAQVFESFSRTWAAVYPRYQENYLATDSHAPNNLRVNVSAQMLNEFYEAFGAKEGDTMYRAPEDRVLLWGPQAG